MYQPKYTITNNLLKYVGVIEGCKEVINTAPIVPAWEKKFVDEANLRTVHYGTAVEGNTLSIDQVKEVLEGKDIVAKERDIQEVLNYKNVTNYLDRLWEAHWMANGDSPFVYTSEMIKRIQEITVNKLVDDGVGEYRKVSVVIRSVRTGVPVLRAPLSHEVEFLVKDFLVWLNSIEGRQVHSVLRAGITHYMLAAIHPFVEGNGRTARAMANLVMMVEGYEVKKFFSLEEHFDREILNYYDALQAVSSSSHNLEDRDLTVWLEYFCAVVAIELTRVKNQVQKLSLDDKLKNRVGRQLALSARQMNLVQFMKDHESISIPEARTVLRGVSDDSILRDLRDLIDKKLVKKTGSTKASRYILI